MICRWLNPKSGSAADDRSIESTISWLEVAKLFDSELTVDPRFAIWSIGVFVSSASRASDSPASCVARFVPSAIFAVD